VVSVVSARGSYTAVKSRKPDTEREPDTDLLAGRYALGDAIGQGRSTVYRGEDLRLRRRVAVKQVQLYAGPEPAGDTRSRAMREAHAAARLSNPRAVTVFDVVDERGSIWLVMELVDAPSLAAVVAAQGPLAHGRAATIGLGVLHALRAAHSVGVVHRDVKPANVLVMGGDRAKLTDFGVASIRDDAKLTATGHIIGSPAYMAPEQARGERAGPPADLWALGATLYFAVEGVSPFPGTSPIAVATAVVYDQHRPSARPGPLTDIIDQLLSKDPADRPTARQVRRALRAARRSPLLHRPHANAALPASAVDSTPPVSTSGSRAAVAGAVGTDGAGPGDADRTEVFPVLTAAPGSGPAVPPEPLAASEATAGAPEAREVPAASGDASPEAQGAVSGDAETGGSASDDREAVPSRAPDEREASNATPEPGRDERKAAGAATAAVAEHRAGDVATRPQEASNERPGPAGEAPGMTGTGAGVAGGAPGFDRAVERRRATPGRAPANRRQEAVNEGSLTSGGSRRAWLLMVVVGVLGGLAVLALAARPTSDRSGVSDQAGTNEAATETTADTTGEPGAAGDPAAATTGTTSAPTSSSTPSTSTTGVRTAEARAPTTASHVPDGWIVFTDPEGAYSIAHPPGWNVARGRRDHTVFIRESGTGTYLLVEWTPDPKPDPVADWQAQSDYFATRHEGYVELRIEPYTYRDYNAAMWEFRYQDGGTVLHAGNLGFVTAGRGYALYFQTREPNWNASQDTFARFREAFDPAP
jgi:eukaryotic-like serine/threonine-protein kinase